VRQKTVVSISAAVFLASNNAVAQEAGTVAYAAIVAVPTLSDYMLVAFGLLLAIAAFRALRSVHSPQPLALLVAAGIAGSALVFGIHLVAMAQVPPLEVAYMTNPNGDILVINPLSEVMVQNTSGVTLRIVDVSPNPPLSVISVPTNIPQCEPGLMVSALQSCYVFFDSAPTPQAVRPGQPYAQDFAAGKPGSPQGWEYYSNGEGRIAVVGGRLRMDDRLSNSVYSLNEAILHVDLVGQSNVQLSGVHWSLSDDTHPEDGISISNDGVVWHSVAAFNVSLSSPFVVNLDAAVAAAGINYTADFRVRFRQYDNQPAPSDGREWDNIRVEIVQPPTPQVVRSGQPYVQDFSAGRPGSSQGWEYFSNGEGRIAVVGGRLRMDDLIDNDVYSLNEAILHVDLAGQSNVQLSGDHWNLSDETHPEDGFVISNDGVTWHSVAGFDVSSSGSFMVDLDAAVAAAGISYTADFRINFRQYDNQPASSDGREWDNIRVEIAPPPP